MKKLSAAKPTLVNKKQFAELHGWQPSYVTKLGNQGRLVMDVTGKLVNVEESNALIEQTAHGRHDVQARHEENRTQAKPPAAKPPAAKPEKPKQPNAINADQPLPIDQDEVKDAHRRKVLADMRRAVAQANKEELELEKLAGNLIEREEAEAAMRFVGASIRSMADVFADQTAPLVAPLTDIEEVRTVLMEQRRNELIQLGDQIKQQIEKLRKQGDGK